MKPEIQQFKLEVLRRFPKAMGRQIFEGHKIANYSGDKPINRRGDWGQNLPPKFSMDDHTGSKGGAMPQIKTKTVKRKVQSCGVPGTLPTTIDTDAQSNSQTDKLQPALKRMKHVSQTQIEVEALTIPTKSSQLCPTDALQTEPSTQVSIVSTQNTSGDNFGVNQGQFLEEKIAKPLLTSEGSNPKSSKRSILGLENGRLVTKSHINTPRCSTLYSQELNASATVCPEEEVALQKYSIP